MFRFRYLLFATTMFGLLVGSFLAITTANSYVSTGKFRFTGSGAEVSEIDPSRATQTSQEAIGTMATYILSTEGLLRKVVEKVKPERILAPYLPGGPGQSAVKTFFFAIQRDWNATRTEDVSPEEALKRLQKTLFIEGDFAHAASVSRCETVIYAGGNVRCLPAKQKPCVGLSRWRLTVNGQLAQLPRTRPAGHYFAACSRSSTATVSW